MSISINPIFPVIAAQGVAPDVVLQPGTVIDARVLRILANDLVRIAIANLSIEVLSEIPLQVGQKLQLAVSQTPDGIRLAVIGQRLAQGGKDVSASAIGGAVSAKLASSNLVGPAPDAPVTAAAKPGADVTPPKPPLTPLQALAVSAAAQAAAPRQGSLAPLFANLGAVAISNAVPAKLRQAAAPLLALRPDLDQSLTGNDVKAAFKSSGLFLEASLASGFASPSSPAGVPDLKAALIVLRHMLLSFGNPAVPESASAPAQQPLRLAPASSDVSAAGSARGVHIAIPPALAPSLISEIDVEEVFLPQARLPVADDFSESSGTSRIFAGAPMPPSAGTRVAAAGAMLNLLQEALPSILQKAGNPGKLILNEGFPLDPLQTASAPQGTPRDDAAVTARAPPPPFRGALPSAQPVVPPSVVSDMPLAATVHHLLDDADAAIARQTLLQVASLPDRADITGMRTDPAAPRWNFEIPFATLAGTAVAQFEISRDDTDNAADAARRVWRARFSLDVEPAGPIHALISLVDDKTSVRMWAERPATAAQLREGASQLSQALSRAELQPGDIVIRDGAPLQPAPAPVGHFLDRAL